MALISIPSIVKTGMQQAMSAILSPTNGLGQNVVLYYAPIESGCPNCLPDPIGHKSSNIYVDGGPMPFNAGQVCIYCGGLYYLAIEATESIVMTINWEPSRFDPTMPKGHRYSDGTIQTRGNGSDLQKVNNCEFMETFSNTGYAHYRYKLMGEPTLSAQTSDLFFWAWWDRA